MRTLVFTSLVLAALATFAGISSNQNAVFSGVRSLSQTEMTSIVGGVCRDCKTTGGQDCQECVWVNVNKSRKYNMGPTANKCVTKELPLDYSCDMVTAWLVCGYEADEGAWLFWDLNEDCLGAWQREVPQSYSIPTASGTLCP